VLRVFPEQKKGGFGRVKMQLLFLGLFLSVAAVSQAGPARGGSSGRSFHAGFVGRGLGSGAVRGGGFNRGGFRGRFSARRNRPVFFQQYGWPGYWYPYGYPYDDLNYSDLEPDSPDYQYWDNSAYIQQSPAYGRQESTNRAAPQNPVVIVINAGNSRPTDSGAPIDPRGLTDPRGSGYANYGYVPTNAAGQQRVVMQDPNEHTDPITPGDPVVPQATPAPQKNTQASGQSGTGPFSKFVVLSYLKDRGKDVISVKNVETNDVQRITSQPNIDHFRIVEIHPNADQRQFEAIISNGSEQGPVRFQF
jgi:hypothetical protein